MIPEIGNITKIDYVSQRVRSNFDVNRPLNNFDVEDKAIISAQAKLLNELEKFNSGEGDVINLALQSAISELTVSANANVINTKKEMMDTILDMMN
ncbi:MAG: hypothetical protein A2287_04590 [Candidatus Melainabacteria bacterium RIFOXYA12_FULL_32_12]|nr:MAG: hypothetical protein A2255_08890 [Candidatus Melainabacteria bacterium RIFOXYA2_FULL_32_9]OGI24482.1 MAG: hypothetical protein A2287_04590 [Candidatus Melainabacteria bacterium RIFOXYA12_FULL_32_12]